MREQYLFPKKLALFFFFFFFLARGRVLSSDGVIKKEEKKECYDCHKKEKETFAHGIVHEPVKEGDCSACHEDHGDKNKLVLTEPIEKKVCFNCHDEKGKKPFVHKPITDGKCTSCHNPHTSDNKTLLKKQVPDICFSCHKSRFNQKHIHTPYQEGKCLTCHDPHESDSNWLTRKEFGNWSNVIADFCLKCHQNIAKGKYIHLVVMAGECTSCHHYHASDYPSQLIEPMDKICYQKCHKTFEGFKSLHKPVKEGKCISCHDPHNSPNNKLLLPKEYASNFRQDRLCYLCHENMVQKYTVKIHRPIVDGKCLSCHVVHSSKNPKLRIYAVDKDMCFSCHKLSEVEDQQSKRHKLDKIHTKCLDCHNPHGK